MSERKLSIFIAHPSDLLTDHQPHGDGLVAFEFISRLVKRGHTLHVMTNSVDIKNCLPEGIKFYPSDISKPTSLIGRWLYVLKVKKTFDKIKSQSSIDIVHQLNPVVPGLTLALGKLEIPIVIGPIVAIASRDRSFLSKILSVKYQLKAISSCAKKALIYLQQLQASALLTATPAAYNKLCMPHRYKSKLVDLSHGIDTQLFSPTSVSQSQNLGKSSKILFLGKVTHYKGIFTLLDAFEQVARQIPDCELLVAGGWYQEIEKVKSKINNMNCSSNITLLGKVTRKQAINLIHDCTVVCMPSLGEPFGMVALEGMACGKPIVGSNSGGLKYLINEQGGYKVKPGDSTSLAFALLKVLQSEDLQITMSNFNRKYVEDNFAWDKIIDKLENLYYELIKESSSSK